MDVLRTLLDRHPIELACLLGWIVLLLPALMYLWKTWPDRRELLFRRLSPAAIRLYYKQFFPSSAPPADHAALEDKFGNDFHRQYGRQHYVLPMILLALISGVGLLVIARSLQASFSLNTTINPKLPIAISAFLGAYAWVLSDHLSRFRSGDFTSHDVYGAVYRFLIAVPLGFSLAAFAKDEVGMGVAFLLGAFPTATLMRFSRRLVTKNLGLGDSDDGGQLELEKLQCIGKSNAERYVDEGVVTIAQLAWANPIDLMIRTNRDWNFVIDSISQALLWVYFEDSVKKLYPLSLRGAQEVVTLLEDLESEEATVKAGAEDCVTSAAKVVGLDKEAFLYVLSVVKEDPYAQFLYKVWA